MDKNIFSIVVLSYNQKSLIKETLNSIYNQSFKNIELVISDDASTDNTQKIITEWVDEHKNRFVNVIINFNEKNLGISANHTAGIKLATGEFVKYIGGDDILLPDAVQKMNEFLISNKEARFCVSKIKMFYRKNDKYVTFGEVPEKRVFNKLKKMNASEQFKILMRGNIIPAPGTFFRKSVFEQYGYFDTKFRTFEDYHQWLKFLLNGEKLFLLDDYTVSFRRHANSVGTSVLYSKNKAFFIENLNVYKEYIFPNLDKLSLIEAFSVLTKSKRYSKLLNEGINKKNYNLARLYRLIDPLWWVDIPHCIIRNLKHIKMEKEIFGKGASK